MGRAPAPTPLEEINLLELFLAAKSRLEGFGPENKAAQLGLAEVHAGIGGYERYLRHHCEALIGNGSNPVNRVDLSKQLHERTDVLERAMKLDGMAAAVQKVRGEHKGPAPIAQALWSASESSQSKTVQGGRDELRPVLDAFLAEEKRREGSGHAVFDKETFTQLGQAYLHYDNALDCVGICDRTAGIVYDPVYAGRSKVKSAARRVLQTVPEGEKSPSRPRKSGKGKSEGDPGAKDKKDSAAGAKGSGDSAAKGQDGSKQSDPAPKV